MNIVYFVVVVILIALAVFRISNNKTLVFRLSLTAIITVIGYLGFIMIFNILFTHEPAVNEHRLRDEESGEVVMISIPHDSRREFYDSDSSAFYHSDLNEEEIVDFFHSSVEYEFIEKNESSYRYRLVDYEWIITVEFLEGEESSYRSRFHIYF